MPSTEFGPPAIPGVPMHRGKVRDIYDLGEHLLLVASDRISAFDWVLPTAVPQKGRVLTQLSAFWFNFLDVSNHLVSTDPTQAKLPPGTDFDWLRGRSMLVRKCRVLPFECVVRGYLAGSAWKEYRERGSMCGAPLPAGLEECSRLPEPIFTPATKAPQGQHDENIPFNELVDSLGEGLARELRNRSIAIYEAAARHAHSCGILLADTKFEFGLCGDELLLIDEVLTPDSSRYWPADTYLPGQAQQSFDKQFVRDWLLASDWDRQSPPPALPRSVVQQTQQKYIEAFERLAGQSWPPRW